jgi:hypothetical protein
VAGEISKSYLGKLAKNLLGFLEKRVNTPIDLKMFADKPHRVGSQGDMVYIRQWRSSRGAMTYTIRYAIPGYGTSPLEIQMSTAEGYSTITLKCESHIKGYTEVKRGFFGNILQKQKMQSARIRDIKLELNRLVNTRGSITYGRSDCLSGVCSEGAGGNLARQQ